MSASGNSNKTNQQQTSQSLSNSWNNSQISGQQLPFLQNMWQMGMNQAAQGQGQTAATQGANQGWLNQGMDAIGGLMDPTAQIQAQSASLASGLGDMFRNEIMPNIQSNSIMAGGFGGGREGVAQGVATGELANAYTTGLGDITARANNQAIGAAGMIPTYAAANMQNTMSGWDNLSNFASILGAPTVLQQGASSAASYGQGTSSGKSGGFGFGL